MGHPDQDPAEVLVEEEEVEEEEHPHQQLVEQDEVVEAVEQEGDHPHLRRRRQEEMEDHFHQEVMEVELEEHFHQVEDGHQFEEEEGEGRDHPTSSGMRVETEMDLEKQPGEPGDFVVAADYLVAGVEDSGEVQVCDLVKCDCCNLELCQSGDHVCYNSEGCTKFGDCLD